MLWDQIRDKISTLQRAQQNRRRRCMKEKERARFFQNPFECAKVLLEEKKNGKMEATAQELEDHLKSHLGDHENSTPLGSPGYVLRPAEPESQFDTTPPRWAEIRQVVDKARSALVPHQLITFALEFFHIPSCIQNLLSNYFSSFQLCYTTQEATISWHPLEKGIAMGCSISQILFTAAFEIILIGGKQIV